MRQNSWMDPIPSLESENPLWLFCNLWTNVENVSSWTHPICNRGGKEMKGENQSNIEINTGHTEEETMWRYSVLISVTGIVITVFMTFLHHLSQDFFTLTQLRCLFDFLTQPSIFSCASWPFVCLFPQFLTSIPPNHCKHLWARG